MTTTAQTKFNRPLGPFACLFEGHPPTPPKRKSGWDHELERRAKAEGGIPNTAKAKTAKVLRVNKHSDVARSTNADTTNRIVGRRNEARSQ